MRVSTLSLVAVVVCLLFHGTSCAVYTPLTFEAWFSSNVTRLNYFRANGGQEGFTILSADPPMLWSSGLLGEALEEHLATLMADEPLRLSASMSSYPTYASFQVRDTTANRIFQREAALLSDAKQQVRKNILRNLSAIPSSSSSALNQVPVTGSPVWNLTEVRAGVAGIPTTVQSGEFGFFVRCRIEEWYHDPLTGKLLPPAISRADPAALWYALAVAVLGISPSEAQSFDTRLSYVNWAAARLGDFTSSKGELQLSGAVYNPKQAVSANRGFRWLPSPTAAWSNMFLIAPTGSGTFPVVSTRINASTAITQADVYAVLMNLTTRQQLCNWMEGCESIEHASVNAARSFMGFSDRITAATDDYRKKKGLFAAGLIVTSVVVLGVLLGLWFWSGSGRAIDSIGEPSM